MIEAGSILSGYQTGSGGAAIRCSYITLSEARTFWLFRLYEVWGFHHFPGIQVLRNLNHLPVE